MSRFFIQSAIAITAILIFWFSFGIITLGDIIHIFHHKNQKILSDGIYQECIISEPNEIARILIQDVIDGEPDHQKATFYDFNKKAYPARIYIDMLEGVMFISDINTTSTVYMIVDYANHKCELSILTGSVTVYDKKGYYGVGDSMNDIDDLFYNLSKVKYKVRA